MDLLDEWLNSFTRQTNCSALSVSVFTDSKILYENYFGTIQPHKKNDIDSVFPFCSLSKSFTSSIYGVLQKENLLNIHQTILEFMGKTSIGFKLDEYDKRYSSTTIKQILTHSSGIKSQNNLHSELLHARYLNQIIYLKTMFKNMYMSRKTFDYNNFMYAFLIYILIKKFNTTWPTLLSLITTSLRLNGICITPPDDTFVYSYTKDTFIRLPDRLFYRSSGSGGVLGTIESLRKWVQCWMNEDITKIISLSYYKDSISKQIKLKKYKKENYTDNYYYGLGWMICNYKGYNRIYHDGNNHYYSSNMCFFPELNFGIAILTNSRNHMDTITIRNTISDYVINYLTRS